jgi:hypothetical protein
MNGELWLRRFTNKCQLLVVSGLLQPGEVSEFAEATEGKGSPSLFFSRKGHLCIRLKRWNIGPNVGWDAGLNVATLQRVIRVRTTYR